MQGADLCIYFAENQSICIYGVYSIQGVFSSPPLILKLVATAVVPLVLLCVHRCRHKWQCN